MYEFNQASFKQIIINRNTNIYVMMKLAGETSTKNLVILFLISGFFYTFSYKLQASQIVNEGINGSITKTFFHPYMQGLTFFIGQSLCLLPLCFKKQPPPPYSTRIFIIPALSDLFSVMLQCTALALISGSTFMMLKGASIVTTLLFSHWLIDLQIRSRHIIGCGLAVVGLAIVGLADVVIGGKANATSQYAGVGYVLMLVSLVFNGFLYAYQQKLLRKYQVGALQMVGWQGVYGTSFSLILVVVLSFVPCPYTGPKCIYSTNNKAYIQLPSVYLSQIFSNIFLLVLVISGMLCNAFYNYYGVTITRNLDSLVRSLLNVCRTGLIWLFGIVISIMVASQSPYRIQSLSFGVNIVKACGFGCIVMGTLIYNQKMWIQHMQQLDRRLFRENDLGVELMEKEAIKGRKSEEVAPQEIK